MAMVDIQYWFILIMRCLELKLFCKWWGIVLVEQVQYEWALSSTRYSRPPKKFLTTFTVSNYPHQSLLCEEPTPPSEAARPNWRPFNQTHQPRAPFMTWQARTPVAWHIPLEDWAPGPPQCYSEADECWSVSSPPRTKDAHGSLPPAITALVRRYGQLS